MLVAHNKDNKKLCFPPTMSLLCLDVYDEPVIISAGSYQHSSTLPFSFFQRWRRIREISRCAAVPQLITAKRSDMTRRWAGSERLELVGRQKYEGVEGAGGIVYELSEVDHHRGSQAKAK